MAKQNGLSRRQLLAASAGAVVLAALGLPPARAAGQRAGGAAEREGTRLRQRPDPHDGQEQHHPTTRYRSGTAAFPPWVAAFVRVGIK